jgi:hypothetical protein
MSNPIIVRPTLSTGFIVNLVKEDKDLLKHTRVMSELLQVALGNNALAHNICAWEELHGKLEFSLIKDEIEVLFVSSCGYYDKGIVQIPACYGFDKQDLSHLEIEITWFEYPIYRGVRH